KIDPSSIPGARVGVLAWPLDSVMITQYFGHTDFSRSNSTLYNGNGHNGVDFRAAVGTRVLAALEGTVLAVGDTDLVCPGASYGKWVLIEHPNGLSSLYAHLSLIKATQSQNVATGDIVGYSGSTGYSTGPHLHFTVYASQGVKVNTYKSKVCGGTYIMPVADLRAYLNPLSYLPTL
ncbi:MAG: M23 family metallopeptidase, partial [bacterium]|nr:M23 family metallopeptidase [bacterium]